MSDENTQTSNEDSGSGIACMVLPMLGHNLLIPNSAIAEMSSVQILESVENSPDWLLGLYSWRGMYIPVISIESINQKPSPPLNPLGRIAVINATDIDENVPFIAIHTQGIPRLITVEDEDIVENKESNPRPYDVMAVRVGAQEFYIPDLAALESAYVNFTTI